MTATLTAIRDVLSAELRTRCIDLGEHLAMSLAEAVMPLFAARQATLREALCSLYGSTTGDPRDMGGDRGDAWRYGVLVGWDDESLDELAPKHGWTAATIERMTRLHAAIEAIDPLGWHVWNRERLAKLEADAAGDKPTQEGAA